MSKRMISVIVPTYNEEEHIENLLSDLSKQSYRNFEVIVVDDCSRDKTVEIVKRFGVKVLVSGKHNLSHSRNLGIKSSKGGIIVNLDTDFRVNKDFLKSVSKTFEDPEVEGVKVSEELAQDTLLERLDYMRTFYKYGGYTQAVRIFRKGIFYDEDLRCFGEDIFINRKIKGKIAYCKGAKILHHRFHTFRELIRSWKLYPTIFTFLEKHEGFTSVWKGFAPLFFPLMLPAIVLHRLFKFRNPTVFLIIPYDLIRTLSFIDGLLDYFSKK